MAIRNGYKVYVNVGAEFTDDGRPQYDVARKEAKIRALNEVSSNVINFSTLLSTKKKAGNT